MKVSLPVEKTYALKEYAGDTGDIADPFGGDVGVYLKTAKEISDAGDKIIPKFYHNLSGCQRSTGWSDKCQRRKKMANQKQIETWLTYLKDTMNFEYVARKVFDRIVSGEGHGLMILQGPPQKGNKSFFLNMVKAFQKGVPSQAMEYFSDDFQRLLAKVDISHFDCVDVKEDYPIVPANLYEVPLCLTLPLSLASASQKKGLKKGHKMVVLCDDLQEFLRHDDFHQMAFLKQIAGLTSVYKEFVFLGAYTLDGFGKGLENTVLSDYTLALGYD